MERAVGAETEMRLQTTELVALGAAALLVVALFLPWFSLSHSPQRLHQDAWVCGTGHYECSGWQTFPLGRWLFLAAAVAPVILTYFILTSHDVRSGAKPDRNLALELVRVTEAAALAAARWVGRGEKEAADQAAVDAMRLMLDTVPMDGVVVIGEGEKDEAPMLYNGESIGDGSPPVVDIAVDPLEGTRLTAQGQPAALSVIALSERGSMFDPGPCVYMEKLAGGPQVGDCL